MAVTGYVGPRELETPAQYLFELHGGFGRGFERRVFEGAWIEPALAAGPAGAGANSIFRRSVFEEVGLFSEDLGPGTPARAADDNDAFYRILRAGYRIVFDPSRIVWHSHRRDDKGLEKVLLDYTISSFAFVTRCLVRDRDWSALRIASWWWFHHFPADVRTKVRRWRGRLPLRYLLAEMRGCFLGPWRMWRSTREPAGVSRRSSFRRSSSGSCGIPGLGRLQARRISRSPCRRTTGARCSGGCSTALPASRTPRTGTRWSSCSTARQTEARRWSPRARLRTASSSSRTRKPASRPYGTRASARPRSDRPLPRRRHRAGTGLPRRTCRGAPARPHEHVALGYCPPVAAEGEWWPLAMRAWWEDHFHRKAEADHEWTYVDFVTGNVCSRATSSSGWAASTRSSAAATRTGSLRSLSSRRVFVSPLPGLAGPPLRGVSVRGDGRAPAAGSPGRPAARGETPSGDRATPAHAVRSRPTPRVRAVHPALAAVVDRFERHQMRRSWLGPRRLVREHTSSDSGTRCPRRGLPRLPRTRLARQPAIVPLRWARRRLSRYRLWTDRACRSASRPGRREDLSGRPPLAVGLERGDGTGRYRSLERREKGARRGRARAR